jgi:hypothetical protein
MQEIEKRLEKEEFCPNSARVLLDSIKWRLAKQLPRSYGDRAALEVSGSLDVATRAADFCPEWMRKEIEEQSRSLCTKPETIKTGL